MHHRTLGTLRLEVSELGLGCMPMSEFYGMVNPNGYSGTIHRAIDLGITLFDTAASFGSPRFGEAANESVLGRALKGRRDSVVLATKFGVIRTGPDRGANNSPTHIRRSIDESLRRLRTDYIDLYYVHRRDPRVPIQETVGTMAELAAAGKVRHLGLSEVTPEVLRDACAVHPITVLQSEYSLVSRHLEDGMIAAARALGVGIVAYAPLGRALLSGRSLDLNELRSDDLRRSLPRFRNPNLEHNLAVIQRIRPIADQLGCTIAQLALAWLLAKGDDIVPIPSTTQIRHLEENAAAGDVTLSAEHMDALDAAVRPEEIEGERNTPSALALMNLPPASGTDREASLAGD